LHHGELSFCGGCGQRSRQSGTDADLTDECSLHGRDVPRAEPTITSGKPINIPIVTGSDNTIAPSAIATAGMSAGWQSTGAPTSMNLGTGLRSYQSADDPKRPFRRHSAITLAAPPHCHFTRELMYSMKSGV
jgi:hypothetical protein